MNDQVNHRDAKLDFATNREASKPESLNEPTLTETKKKNAPNSGSPELAAEKRAAEVLHFLHKLEQLDYLTVANCSICAGISD